ncbi:MAG TPA: HAMP domain-containing sensor histidine kinase [Burkholderiaceae bacterium]|nr:HAMP domain-containing sensor histidine kinase [Burkholderiaceae bacterium]
MSAFRFPRFFPQLSLRYKIPLRVTLLVLLVALSVTVAIVLRQANQAREDLDRYSSSLARALANTLQPYLRHDDVWRAYEIIRSAIEDAGATSSGSPPVIVTDATGMIFVSSKPREFPVGASLASIGPDFAYFTSLHRPDATAESAGIGPEGSDRLFYAAPIKADTVRLGDVVLVSSRSALWPRYVEILKQASAVTVLALALLLPASWFWARRTATPLVSLASAMRKVPARLDDISEDTLADEGDEIGELTRTFRSMLADLKNKRELENQVVASERLAAIGRLAAGIAHEINNPLGGMLNAISTYRKHGSNDPLVNRTLALLERGLTQIRASVGALLVETRLSDRPLTREDFDDVLLLVAPQVDRKGGAIDRDVRVDFPLPLPAGQVRQILINLLLNAANAIEPGGRIGLVVELPDPVLRIRVHNSGRHIPEEKLQYLFEPFTLAAGEGSGLGLWVVYQIVKQLGGSLSVDSKPDSTFFAVELPLDSTVTQLPHGQQEHERASAAVLD